MLPVLASPMVKVCLAVVAKVAAVEKMRLPAEVAVPVPEKIWNLAEEVAVPPMAKSSVMFKGETTPRILCQLETATTSGCCPRGIPPETVRTWEGLILCPI